MVTAVIFKFTFFVTLVAVLYCFMTGVSFGESLYRGLIVFAGFYFTLIVFFVGTRLIFTPNPKKKKEPEAQKAVESETKMEVASE